MVELSDRSGAPGGMTIEAIRARHRTNGECSECDRHLDIGALLEALDVNTLAYNRLLYAIRLDAGMIDKKTEAEAHLIAVARANWMHSEIDRLRAALKKHGEE
jgi:hypothetical protein